MLRRAAIVLAVAVPMLAAAPAVAQTGPTVFAAASLTDAMRAVNEAWVARGNPPIRFNFAASSTLARQMEQGAEPELFVSADEPWMDWVAERGLIARDSRVSPIGNALVLIAPGASRATVALAPGVDLAAALGADGRLAVGDPSHVPAGRYAEQALRALGAWDAVAPRLARADNVRAALLLVERGEAPLGIVYATDAAAAPGVRVVAVFPPGTHPPITYPFAVGARRDGPAARALLAFLTGPDAIAAYRRFGFVLPESR